MSYRLQLSEPAEKKLRKLPAEPKARIAAKISQLRENPRPPGCLKLEDDELDGWRVRVGKLRILYLIDDVAKLVFVYDIDKRDRVYGKRRR